MKCRPIFEELSNEDHLKKCLHGQTQNQNESFNATIWERIPKSKYASLPQLRFGVYDAVANFNIGRKASILVFEKMHMEPGKYMSYNCNRLNKRRLWNATYKNMEGVKLKRKKARGAKHRKSDKDKQVEGKTYAPGGF